MSLIEVLTSLRQWTYPAAFRIRPKGQYDRQQALADILAQLELYPQTSESPPVPGEDRSGQLIPDELAVTLCNSSFWIGRQIQQMESEGLQGKEIRSIRRSLKRLESALDANGIRCVDIQGQRYDEGRLDFEPLGEAEIRVELEHKTIISCECPVVTYGERLLQKARGTVARPA